MNNSIRSKLFKWNIILVLVVLICTFLSVQLFSESIYKQKTIQLIQKEMDLINDKMNDDDVEGLIAALDISAFRLGATISFYNESDELLFISNQPGQGMGRGKGNAGVGNNKTAINIEEGQLVEVQMTSGKEVLLYKEVLETNDQLMIQLPKEKIDDALWVFQQLLSYVAVIALIVAIIGSRIMSKHFSQPIVALKDLAENITALEFEKRYDGDRSDEIGQLGDSLNALSTELKSTIEQLTLELDKEKTMDVLRTQFVAQASHELQTPLTVIRNYIEAIEDGMIEEDELPAHISIMQEEIEGMSSLVKGLLDLSQLRSGKFNIAFTIFDVTALITTELALFMKQSTAPHIEISENLYNKEVMILGDPIRIKQAIRNLMTNGLKHCSGHLLITTVVEEDKFQFSVENSGRPIKETELENLWEVFYKEEDNQKKGTGLGLAIIKAIIEQHGGTYGIENTEIGVKSYFELNIQV